MYFISIVNLLVIVKMIKIRGYLKKIRLTNIKHRVSYIHVKYRKV